MTTDRSTLVKFAWLSVSAAVVTMVIKFVAYSLTDSIGLLSDALESSVNLVAAIGAVVALSLAARPADEDHEYGHAKAEYFSSLAEGLMIMLAAATIAWAAIDRLLHPQELEKLGIGIAIAVVASLINLGVALVLLRVGRRERSIALEGDSKHLMTDVWTTAGVVVAVALVGITGIEWLDPVIGLAVAANIIIAGLRLVARSSRGLMDSAIPPDERSLLDEVLESYTSAQTQFHGVRTRQAGYRSFMSVHVLVPGSWSVQRSHDLVERIEADLRDQVPFLTVDTHVEPLEDPRSFADEELDRRGVPPSARPMGPEADKLR
ncbi:MAG: cation transporter [Actinomycetia bacterium]|nr:cation transporter [Actinomycetes bacterium]